MGKVILKTLIVIPNERLLESIVCFYIMNYPPGKFWRILGLCKLFVSEVVFYS